MIWKWLLQNLARMNLKTYLFFLVLTSAIWFLMQLSDEYSRKIDIPLKFKAPEGYIITRQSSDKIRVSISAKGYKMISLSDEYKKALVSPLAGLRVTKNGDGLYHIALPASKLVSQVAAQLDMRISRRDISPDTIYFTLDKKSSAKIPVRLGAKMDIVQGFRIYGTPLISPAKIEVTGPKHILDTLSFISTKKIQLKNLNSSFEKEVALSNPSPLLDLSREKVKVKVEIVEFIEAETQVPVSVNTDIPGLKVKVFPPAVKVKYQIAMPDYKKISDTLFTVSVKIDSLAALRNRSLIPVLKRFPPYVENPRLSTDKVDFIIIKK